jgi:exosortase A-associated hydrolase 1
MTVDEQALVLDCEGASMICVLSKARLAAGRGVLIVVGGPQYRVGSHRQFLLLARHLADLGVPTLRFDYRGMGDSDGEKRTFESVKIDIRCAIDLFFASVPGLKDVVIWGLCDAASAALFYAHQDARVTGLVLLNPWVRTEQGAARAHFRHYYLRRLFQASLWGKIGRGEFNVREAATALGRLAADALGRGRASDVGGKTREELLPARMAEGLVRFRGRVLLILSGNDLTAQEFKDVTARSSDWRKLLEDARVTRCDLRDANHTFARREWRDQVADWTAAWMRSF